MQGPQPATHNLVWFAPWDQHQDPIQILHVFVPVEDSDRVLTWREDQEDFYMEQWGL